MSGIFGNICQIHQVLLKRSFGSSAERENHNNLHFWVGCLFPYVWLYGLYIFSNAWFLAASIPFNLSSLQVSARIRLTSVLRGVRVAALSSMIGTFEPRVSWNAALKRNPVLKHFPKCPWEYKTFCRFSWRRIEVAWPSNWKHLLVSYWRLVSDHDIN